MPMSDFRRKKLLYVFKTYFDVDNSGAIDQKDFELAAERMCSVRNWNKNEGKGAEANQRLLKIWDVLKGADTDSDGTVDEEEWVALWEDYANGKRGQLDWQELYRDFIFHIIDLSGEGTIEENEFIVVNTRGGVPHEDCVEAFKKLTKNGAVKINKAEFSKLWEEYFTSDDPEARGNLIYGKLSY